MENTKIRVLHAEDDKLCAELTKVTLLREGFEVKIVPDGAEAWKVYREWKPDILLLDLDMPGKNGLELTQMVRENDHQTYIAIYTSHGDAAREVAVLDAGADEFIHKERAPEVLVARLNRVRERIKKCMNIPHSYQLSEHTTFNSITRMLTIDGTTKQLKSIDGRFLQLLCAKNNEVALKTYLIQGIWGRGDTNKESELKKYASRVRAELKADPSIRIECRDGGYVLFLI